MLLLYAILVLICIAGWIIRILVVSARRQRLAQVISTLSSCVRQNLPLPDTLHNSVVGNTKVERILSRIADGVEEGLPLCEAVRASYPRCQPHVLNTLYAAECVNQLPEALASLEQELVARFKDERSFRPVHPLYPVLVMLFSFVVLVMLMIFVMPKFQEVFKQQGQPLPAATAWLMDSVDFFLDSGLAFLMMLLLGLMVIFGIIYVVKLFRNRRAGRQTWLSRLADWAKWQLPLVRWFEWNYSMARVINMLRLALVGGRTIDQAIEAALLLDMNQRVWKRIQLWRNRIAQGQTPAQAAKAAGLGQSLAWAFDTTLHDGLQTPAILQSLEEFHRSSYRCRLAVARQILWPCVVLVMGLWIGFTFYAIMAPMIGMVHHVTAEAMP